MRYLFGALDPVYSSPFRNSETIVWFSHDALEGARCDSGHVTLISARCLVGDEYCGGVVQSASWRNIAISPIDRNRSA